MTWFLENSSLYEEEISLLQKHGFSYEVDEVEKSKGNLIVNVDYQLDNITFNLKCEYPSSYPFFAVKVSCQNFPEGRHKCPISFNICLFFDESSSWSPHDSLASVIDERVPIIYDAHKSPDVISAHETNEGYQVSGQLRYEDFSSILCENIEFDHDEIYGDMTISLNSDVSIERSMKGCIKNISLKNGIEKVSPDKISNRLNKEINARWVRLTKNLTKFTPDELLNLAIEINPKLKKPLPNKIGKNRIDIVAIAFPEEQLDRKESINWLFIIRRSKKLGTNKYIPAISIIRSDYYTRDNLLVRTPKIKGLEDKKVLLVGVGALGSQVALQLARTGIKELKFIDYDILQAGNLPRWIPAYDFIGTPKVFALQQIILRNYPFLQCEPISLKVGSTGQFQYNEKLTSTHDILLDLINDADIVIDCAAESNVSHYLSELCNFKKKDYVWATATNGGWGGIVGKSLTIDGINNWFEFSKQYSDGDITKPSSDDNSMVQPTGCFSPTFTGAGFDLDQVSLMTTRLSVSILLQSIENSYNSFNWDVAVLDLWDADTNNPIPANWTTYNV